MKTIEFPAHLDRNFRLRIGENAKPEGDSVPVRLIVVLQDSLDSQCSAKRFGINTEDKHDKNIME